LAIYGGAMRGRPEIRLSPRTRAETGQAPLFRLLFAVTGAAVFGSLSISPLATPSFAQTVEDLGSPVRHIAITLNKSRTLGFDRRFSTAVIGAPDIADVLPMTETTLYVQGKKVGTTNVSVFDAQKHLIAVVDLEVTPDVASLHTKISASTGGKNIGVSSVNGQVVLSGEANDAVTAARAVEVAQGLSPSAPVINAMRVRASQQVMLKVRILEVDRNAARAFGINWAGKGNGGGFVTGLGTITGSNPPTSGAGAFPGSASTLIPFGVFLAKIVNTNGLSIDTLVSALEDKGLVKSLAEPDLVALSGERATFLVGGEIPIPVVQGTNATNGVIGASYAPSISVEWKQYGVGLDFTPTALNDGIIDLQLDPSVTEVDTTNSLNINGTTIPSLTERKAHTAVELRDGQSFAIAGLLQAQDSNDIAQLPWLGNVPILGTLFRSTHYQKQETDLVIIVSPHLVRPAPVGQRLATPFDTTLPSNDVDLFLMSDTERKKRYTEFVASGGGVQGPYGHILDSR
jgi:pilus assembly protein CpaC